MSVSLAHVIYVCINDGFLEKELNGAMRKKEERDRMQNWPPDMQKSSTLELAGQLERGALLFKSERAS